MYTRVDFGKELKEKVAAKEDRALIGIWSYEIYLQHIAEIDDDMLDEVLLTLNKMEVDPGFFLSYKRLNEIADDLISGKKEINLDY